MTPEHACAFASYGWGWLWKLIDVPQYVELDPATLARAEAFTQRQLHNAVLSVRREPILVYEARQAAERAAVHREREQRLQAMAVREWQRRKRA